MLIKLYNAVDSYIWNFARNWVDIQNNKYFPEAKIPGFLGVIFLLSYLINLIVTMRPLNTSSPQPLICIIVSWIFFNEQILQI